MSKIHTALKESAVAAHSFSPPRDAALSSLDKKLIAAGVAPDILAEAHNLKGNNGSGFFDSLIRKKAVDEIQLLKILAGHFGLSLRPELPMESINIDFTQNVSIQYLKKHKIVPLITSQDAAIAINDPTNFQPVDDLRRLLQSPDLPVPFLTGRDHGGH
jgi:general secretion pathway protein E